ncbi:MAG: FAD:protein FMN transferase, partial [Gemmatimonadetes bacterium]|nr:FAD:protein FMN transferase [Gemmatimonadota bacterium]
MSVERRPPSRRDALRITAAVGLTLGMGGSVLRRARLHRVRETRPALGTLVTLTLIHPDPDEARTVLTGAFAGIDALEDALSRHRPTSALARLNRTGVLVDPP